MSKFDSTGELDVGPASLRIFISREQLVPIGKGLFWAHGSVTGQTKQARPLNWNVVSQLERVGVTGSAKVVKRKQQFVRKISGFKGRHFGFASRGVAPGLYRLTVEIQNRADKVLEKHQQAFRALPPRSDLRLSKSFDSLSPGEGGFIRIDNFGTVAATFGANYRLWSANGEEVPLNLVFGNVRYMRSAGSAGPCMTFTAPSNLAPGEYKIGSVASDLLKRNQLLTASFVVR